MLSAQATPVISTERGDGGCSGSAMDNFGSTRCRRASDESSSFIFIAKPDVICRASSG
jgi:hypothetical protein